MKPSFSPFTLRYSAQLLVVALVSSTALTRCYPVRSKDEAIGTFELNGNAGRIRLDVAPSGTFAETITVASGQVQILKGSWTWAEGRISFEGLWIPKAFAPDYILEADAKAPPGVRYTEPGHWSITTEKHWGITVLSVFPDSNIEFRKVAGQSPQ